MPYLPLDALPHPLDTLTEAEVLQHADRFFDQVISRLVAGVRVRRPESKEE